MSFILDDVKKRKRGNKGGGKDVLEIQEKKQINKVGIDATEDEILAESQRDELGKPMQLRRSQREKRIKLDGRVATTFYKNLEILFFSGANDRYKKIFGSRVAMQRVHADPPVYVADDFLRESELAYFDSQVKKVEYEESFLDDNDGNSIVDKSYRTSSFFGFGKGESGIIRKFERRVSDILGCQVQQIEPIQLVRYQPGEFFNVHHDMAEVTEDDKVRLPQKVVGEKLRILTIFIYLNSLSEEEGGCTYFPQCSDLRIRPRRGRLAMWCNVNRDGQPEPRTVHAGEKLISTRRSSAKCGLNVWIGEE